MPSQKIADALSNLADGHHRFLSGQPHRWTYSKEELQAMSASQSPIAAIVACSDSRVAPEILFDQPLGGIFASRVPGNVASDSAKWMLDMAVGELHVPVAIVLGHIGCVAVNQIVDGRIGGDGGSLRLDIQKAVHRARLKNVENVRRQSVIENVFLTIDNLKEHSMAVRRALDRQELGLLGGAYDMATGEIHLFY
jgi:carbonic anhydrase